MIKKAMIMAAGVGSRLEPLSSIVPKPLVPLANVPAMDILVNHLISFGIKDIIANTYFKAEDIQNHYKQNNFGINFCFIKEEELSGTAGGVKKCEFFFDKDEDFIVMSGDGLTDIDINAAYKSHKNSNAIATIVLKEVPNDEIHKYGIVVPDTNGYVKSFQEKPQLSEAKSNLANTGIYIFKYDIFNHIPQNIFYDFAKNVFPALLSSSLKINTYLHRGYWSDIGSLNQYHQSNTDILNNLVKSFFVETNKTETGAYIKGNNSIISNSAVIDGYCIIGNNCKIGRNVHIENSILWDNINIEDNITVKNSIILTGTRIGNSVNHQIVSENKLKEHTLARV